jgi:membrane protein DedA with SNARE-associated domain
VLDKAALWAYLTVFTLLVAAGLGFPIPEELPIVGAGMLVGHVSGEDPAPDVPIVQPLIPAPGAPFPAQIPWFALAFPSYARLVPPPTPAVPVRWWIMLPVCILGVVISDILLYGVGRFWGPRLLETRGMKKLVPPERRQRIEDNFHKYGVFVLLFARFLPTIRSPIFIMAGIMRLSFGRFVLADGLYALPGVSLLFFLAYWLGDQFRDLIFAFEGRIAAARPVLVLLGIAAVVAYLIYHFLRHPIATGDPRQEIPVIGKQVANKIAPCEHPAQVENSAERSSADRLKARVHPSGDGSLQGNAAPFTADPTAKPG